MGPLNFDNRFTSELPADPEAKNFRREVKSAFFSRVLPVAPIAPKLLSLSTDVCDLIGLKFKDSERPQIADIFSGKTLLPGMDPFAMCYGGHQFGHWAGQLGDGRAINLGEVVNPQGQRWMLQLKGAGPTPYARGADGLAVLRSSLREYVCSEAMFYLNVPTSRALSLVLTGDEVIRDMLYDGHPALEPGAVVCRVAPTFVRFGNFEIFAARGDVISVKQLADHVIHYNFPHLGKPSVEVYEQWFSEICQSTARLMVEWLRVGFVHGVMNTDNMSILGLTIDYGPYGWLDSYDPNWTPNTTDSQGRRYAFGRQAQIAHWNLCRLAEALVPLGLSEKSVTEALDGYVQSFEQGYRQMLLKKLGLIDLASKMDSPVELDELISSLFSLLSTCEVDWTMFFRLLATLPCHKAPSDEELFRFMRESFYNVDTLPESPTTVAKKWLSKYEELVILQNICPIERMTKMNAVNPKYVFRNYLAQEAIDKATLGDLSQLHELEGVLKHPYDEQPQFAKYFVKRPDWAKSKVGCSMLSCSS